MTDQARTAFDQAIALTPVDGGPDHYRWDVPAGWEQGRGAWGGLVVGACLQAVREAQGDGERRLRTISAHLMAPALAGPVTIEVRAARTGSAMSTWSTTVRDESGATVADAMVIAGQPRAEDLVHLAGSGVAQAPTARAWQECPVIPIEPPLGPAFGAHLEFRPIEGIPMSSGPARVLGWIRLPDQGPWTDVQALSLVDSYWPSMYPTLPGPRPMATVSFSAHLLADPASLPAAEPLLYEATMAAAHDGFTTETRRLWSTDSRLVVENLQSIVVIR